MVALGGNFLNINFRSKLRISKAVYKSVDLFSFLAHGAFVGGIALIVFQVSGGEDGANGIAHALVGGCENSADARNVSVVVFYRLNSRLCGVTCGNRRVEDQHILTLDHGDSVVAEEKLASDGVLGGNYVYRLVGVDVSVALLRQLTGNTSAYDLSAVEAEDGVNDGVLCVIGNKLLCYSLRLGKTCLLRRNVDVIVNMAVAGCKMPFGHSQKKIFVICLDLIRLFEWHFCISFFLILNYTTEKGSVSIGF